MTDQARQLFLIDGSAYIFRAFFAIPPLTNAGGLPTNAIFGFTNILLKFLKQYRPEYVAVALDAGRLTFRNEMYADYKGNRPEAPADLIPQFPYFRKVLDALNLPLLELPGYEADDIIATLCERLANQGCELVVVSSDKDLMQLVTDGIKLLDSAKDRWIGTDEIREKFGVTPEQITQVMGLMGDASDNIPGVKGIGEKTASALIQQFQSLENLFDHLDDMEQMKLRGARAHPANSPSRQRPSLSEPRSSHSQTRRAPRHGTRRIEIYRLQSGKNPHAVYRTGIHQPRQAHRKRRLNRSDPAGKIPCQRLGFEPGTMAD